MNIVYAEGRSRRNPVEREGWEMRRSRLKVVGVEIVRPVTVSQWLMTERKIAVACDWRKRDAGVDESDGALLSSAGFGRV